MARRALPLLLAALLMLPAVAVAADWGGIDAGVSTLEQVRERYGAPSREAHVQVEGYDTIEWIYEGPRAPAGILRMIVDFGLLAPGGYKANVVRVFRLEPKPHIFAREAVINGWGVPDGISTDSGQVVFFYKIGLLVTFEKAGDNAVTLNFAPPQPDAPSPSAPATSPRR